MANFILKVPGTEPLSHPTTRVTLKAEKITGQPERWMISFIIAESPIKAVRTLELSTAEMDELFAAYQVIKPIAQRADNFRDSSGPIG